MKYYKSWFTVMVLALTLLGGGLGSGCSSTKLDPAGVYQSDQLLFQAENLIVSFHDRAREFLDWEMRFRAVLPKEVSKAADFIRVNERRWIDSSHALRDAYVNTPSAENKDKLQLSLNLLQTALQEASAYMIASKKEAPNQGIKGIKPITAG